MAEQSLDKFHTQTLANTAWAFATVGQQDEQLFKALARMAEWHRDKFNLQALANMAWAFATVRQQDEQLFKAFEWNSSALFWRRCRLIDLGCKAVALP